MRRSGRAQAHATDMKIFLEAIRLKEIGELERADVATLGPDFTLEIANNRAQVIQRIAGPQEFKPHAFALESQA